MASSRRGSSRKRSPLVGHTWHASSPVPVNTGLPNAKEASPFNYNAADPLSDGLWSGEWKLFADSNSSDWPSQSVASSTSWSDELETESTKKLSEQFQLLESTLYGDANEQQLANSNLAAECRQWKERFPHLRAVGTGLKQPTSTSVGCCQTDDAASDEQQNGVKEEGEQKEDDVVDEDDGDEEEEEEEEEEVIAAHGQLEENSESKSLQIYSSDSKLVPVKDLKEFRDKVKKAVLDQIFANVWPDVVKRIEPVFKKLLERNKVNLHPPPAVTISTQGDSSTYSSSDVGFESSSADQFLQVSPVPMPLSVRENSGRKSRMSTISHITANLLDYSNDFHQPSRLAARHKSALAPRNAPIVKLVFPPPTEKLLTPIQQDLRNSSQSGKKSSAKMSASNRSRLTSFQQKHSVTEEQPLNGGRFYNRTENRSGVKNGRKKSPLGNWTRHGVLPPISLKDNMKVSSAFSKRSSSALQQNGPGDLDTRPNTSLPTKNGIALQPLDKFDMPKDNMSLRMEMAQQWLHNQITPANYGKSNMTVHENMNGGWRSRMTSIHRK